MQVLAPLLRAIDAPARETLLLEKRSLFATVAPAMLGAFLIAASTLATTLFTNAPVHELHALFGAPRADVLRAVFEALAVVFPSAIIVAAYLELRIGPRAHLAAVAIALLVAGIVAASTLPLLAFLALVARARPMFAPGLLLPFIVVGAIAATIARVLRALDPRAHARIFAVVTALCFIAAFLLRASNLFQRGSQ